MDLVEGKEAKISLQIGEVVKELKGYNGLENFVPNLTGQKRGYA
jgi:hypothetical protein